MLLTPQTPFTSPVGVCPQQQPSPSLPRGRPRNSASTTTTTTTTSSPTPHKNGVLQALPHHPKLSPSSSLSSSRSSLSGPGPGSLQRCHSAFLGRRGPRGSLPGMSSGTLEESDAGLGGSGRRGSKLRWSGRSGQHPRPGHSPGPGSVQEGARTDGLSLPHSLARRVTSTPHTPAPQTHSPRPTRRPSAPAAPTTSPSGGGGGSGRSSSGHHHHYRFSTRYQISIKVLRAPSPSRICSTLCQLSVVTGNA